VGCVNSIGYAETQPICRRNRLYVPHRFCQLQVPSANNLGARSERDALTHGIQATAEAEGEARCPEGQPARLGGAVKALDCAVGLGRSPARRDVVMP
jgi:hypothetical protein